MIASPVPQLPAPMTAMRIRYFEYGCFVSLCLLCALCDSVVIAYLRLPTTEPQRTQRTQRELELRLHFYPNLFSVLWINRSIFSRCAKTISAAPAIATVNSGQKSTRGFM